MNIKLFLSFSTLLYFTFSTDIFITENQNYFSELKLQASQNNITQSIDYFRTIYDGSSLKPFPSFLFAMMNSQLSLPATNSLATINWILQSNSYLFDFEISAFESYFQNKSISGMFSNGIWQIFKGITKNCYITSSLQKSELIIKTAKFTLFFESQIKIQFSKIVFSGKELIVFQNYLNGKSGNYFCLNQTIDCCSGPSDCTIKNKLQINNTFNTDFGLFTINTTQKSYLILKNTVFQDFYVFQDNNYFFESLFYIQKSQNNLSFVFNEIQIKNTYFKKGIIMKKSSNFFNFIANLTIENYNNYDFLISNEQNSYIFNFNEKSSFISSKFSIKNSKCFNLISANSSSFFIKSLTFVGNQLKKNSNFLNLNQNNIFSIKNVFFENDIPIFFNFHQSNLIILNNVTLKSIKFIQNQQNLLLSCFSNFEKISFSLENQNSVILKNTKISQNFNETTQKAVFQANQNNKIFLNDSLLSNSKSNENSAFFTLTSSNNLTLMNSQINGAKSDQNGGTFHCNNLNKIYVVNSSFSNSSANGYAGYGYLFQKNTIFIKNSFFQLGKSLNADGGHFYLENQNNFILISSNLTLGISKIKAGIIKIVNYNKIVLRKSAITKGNSLTDTAGLIHISEWNNVLMETMHFQEGFAEQSSGGMFFIERNNKIAILNSMFYNGTCRTYGGVMFTVEKNIFKMKNSKVIHGLAILYSTGLCFFNRENIVMLVESTFFNGSAKFESGGAFFSDKVNLFVIDRCTVEKAVSWLYGGMIFMYSTNKLLVKNSVIKDGTSYSGGFFYASNKNILVVKDSIFIQALAKKDGGVFLVENKNYLLFSNMTLLNHSSMGDAALVYCLDNNVIVIEKCYADRIFAQFSAPIVSMLNFNYILINSSIFENLISEIFNGAVGVKSKTNIIIFQNSSFSNAFALGSGGLIYSLSQAIIFVLKCNFKNFYVGQNGGLIGIKTENVVVMKECKIENITCGVSGGIISATSINKIKSENIQLLAVSAKDNSDGFYLGDNNLAWLTNINLENMNGNNKIKFFIVSENKNTIEISKMKFMKSSISLISAKMTNFSISYVKIGESSLSCGQSFFYFENSVISIFKAIFIKNTGNMISFLKQSSAKLDTISFIKIKGQIIESQSSTINAKCISILSVENNNKCSQTTTGLIYGENSIVNLKESQININKNNKSIVFLKNSNAEFQRTDFNLNRVYTNGGGIHFENIANEKKVFAIKKSKFLMNFVKQNGGGLYILNSANPKTNIVFRNNTFLKNKGKLGGAFYVKESPWNFTVRNSKFFKNFASGFGGAIYHDSSKEMVKLIRNTFLENQAKIGGAFFLKQDQVFQTTQQVRLFYEGLHVNKIQKNEASSSGPTTATTINSLTFGYPDKIFKQQKYFSYFFASSAQTYQFCLTNLTGFDQQNQYMEIIENSYFSISNFEIFEFTGNHMPSVSETWNKLKKEQGYFEKNFNKTTIKQNNKLFFEKKSNGLICLTAAYSHSIPINVRYLYVLRLKLRKNDPILLEVSFRSCQYGEALFYVDNVAECRLCDPNFFLFKKDNSRIVAACEECKPQFYCYGGNMLSPKPGYWRLYNQSTSFYSCPLKENCLGNKNKLTYDEDLANGECSVGYKGVLCRECADGYGSVNNNYCAPCGSGEFNVNFALGILVKFAIVIAFIFVAIKTSIKIVENRRSENSVILSNYIKILTNHMYVITLFTEIPINFDLSVKNRMNFIVGMFTNVSDAFKLDCFFKEAGYTQSPLYMILVISLIYPVILFICSVTILFTLLRFSNLLMNKSIKDSETEWKSYPFTWAIISCLVNIYFICYMDILKQNIQMLSYTNVGDNLTRNYRLLADYSVEFFDPFHLRFVFLLVIPVIIVFGIGFIGALFFVLRKQNKVGDLESNKEVLFKYGFIYVVFKKKYYFWDLVILLRKLIITIIFFYFAEDLSKLRMHPIIYMMTVLVFCFVLQILMRPFKGGVFDSINVMETISLCTLIVSAYMVMIYISYQQGEGDMKKVSVASQVLIYFSNLAFIIYWCAKVAIVGKKQIKAFTNKIKSRLTKNSLMNSIPIGESKNIDNLRAKNTVKEINLDTYNSNNTEAKMNPPKHVITKKIRLKPKENESEEAQIENL